jgi:hypothetical protein
MKIECPHCSAQLRGKPELAGKRVSCPKCGEQVTIPAASKETPAEAAAIATSELWEVRTEDGTIYGPVEKVELDQWVAEDRLDEHCQLRQANSQSWTPIWKTYDRFAPTPEIETAPAFQAEQPVQKQPVAKKEVAAVSSSQVVEQTHVVVPTQTTRYPMMLLASKIYKIMGWIVLVVGSLGVLVYFVITMLTVIGAFATAGALTGLLALATGLFTVTVASLYLAIMVISCWFVSEAIGWMMDLQENSSKSNFLLSQIAQRLSK